jgi:phenylalanyl-tRNA synthetase beta chain
MKLEYKSIIDSLLEKPSMELLSEKLFQLGHEHEIEGSIFNMELTPNRGDCLSVNGLARDLNIFFGKGPKKEIYTNSIDTLELDFENLSPKDCPSISFLEIEIGNNQKKYKPYLESYFKNLRLNKNNFFTDISNYLSYETGQPTHCYDRDKINRKLTFVNRTSNENFKTLLDTEVQLEGNNCVFVLGEDVINLAGVIGGKNTACSSDTKKILVECAFFNPESVIGKSIKYNINSDAAHKFERGVNILSQEETLRRFIKIVEDHVDILSLKIKFFNEMSYQTKRLDINETRINNILGTNLSRKEYLDYLFNLGFAISDEVEIPSFRNDIATQNDLAEEIARAIGYDFIKSEPLNLVSKKNSINLKENVLSSFLVNNGFNEVVNFPFCDEKLPSSISIDNPLDSQRDNMRISTKNSLIKSLLYNERRQHDSVKLFEIADIYFKKSNIVSHVKKIGIIASGRQGHNHRDFSKKIDINYMSCTLDPILQDSISLIEEIPRSMLDSKIKDKIFYIECNLDLLSIDSQLIPIHENKDVRFTQYKEISTMPSSSRDVSFSIENPKNLNRLIRTVDSFKSPNLKKSFCFDYYINSKTGIIKIGFRFIFQSSSYSLSDSEVDNEMKLLMNETLKIDGISIPGILF